LKAYIRYQGIQRVETFLYPNGALREALLNLKNAPMVP
jgi:ATP-dependent DNA helicase RecG